MQKRTKGRPRTANSEATGIKSVEIALEILSVLLEQSDKVSLTELSHATGMATNKLHRYLVSLTRHGMIAKSEQSGLYNLGPAARRLGAAALTRFDGFEDIDEAAHALSAATDIGTFIYVWSEGGPVMVRSHMTRDALITIKVGSTLPLVNSGCGPVFLACLPREWTEPVVRAEFPEERKASIQKKAHALAKRVQAELSKHGAYWADPGIVTGVPVCAAPIFDASGQLHSVLGATPISRPFKPSRRSSIVSAVATTAARVSETLGYSHDA